MDLSRLMGDEDGESDTGELRVDLDSRADTCVAGKNYRLLEETGFYADVSPYSEEYAPIENIPIATVATAYTSGSTGETVILVGHQHLYFGERMKHSLLNPNQLRHYGGKVHDCPWQYDINSPFSIELPDEDGSLFEIPLKLHGVIGYFDTHFPSDDELKDCRTIYSLITQEPSM